MPLDLVHSKQYLFKTILSVQNVLNICDKIGVKVFLGGIKVEEEYCKYFSKFNNYIHFYNSHLGNIDYGNDNSHPGPKTHDWYADQFYKSYLRDLGKI